LPLKKATFLAGYEGLDVGAHGSAPVLVVAHAEQDAVAREEIAVVAVDVEIGGVIDASPAPRSSGSSFVQCAKVWRGLVRS